MKDELKSVLKRSAVQSVRDPYAIGRSLPIGFCEGTVPIVKVPASA